MVLAEEDLLPSFKANKNNIEYLRLTKILLYSLNIRKLCQLS